MLKLAFFLIIYIYIYIYIVPNNIRIIFPGLIRRGSFPECWRSANVTALHNGAPSLDRENYRPILMTPILSKVYEKLVSYKLSNFCEKHVFLPAAQFAYRKGLGCTDALLTMSHHIQKFLDTGMDPILFSSTLLLPSIE